MRLRLLSLVAIGLLALFLMLRLRPSPTPVYYVPPITPEPTPQAAAEVRANIQAPFDWYVWQGYAIDLEIEPAAAANCGPAIVAMAYRYASNNQLRVSPEAVRAWMPGRAGTDAGTTDNDLIAALDAWAVPWRQLDSMAAVAEAVRQGHIVLFPILMEAIEDEAQHAQPVVTEAGELLSGRFNTYTGPHWIVIKGIVQDSATGRTYFVAYDPNVWEGNPIYYYRDAAAYPKGVDRLYEYTQVERGYRAVRGNQAIEVLASPASPIAPDPARLAVLPTLEEKASAKPLWCADALDVASIGGCPSP